MPDREGPCRLCGRYPWRPTCRAVLCRDFLVRIMLVFLVPDIGCGHHSGIRNPAHRIILRFHHHGCREIVGIAVRCYLHIIERQLVFRVRPSLPAMSTPSPSCHRRNCHCPGRTPPDTTGSRGEYSNGLAISCRCRVFREHFSRLLPDCRHFFIHAAMGVPPYELQPIMPTGTSVS